MSQGQLAGYVADGVDAGDVGDHAVVDGDIAPVGGDADGFQAQIFGVGLDADGDEHLVEAGGFGCAVFFDGEGYSGGVGLGSGYAGAGLHIDAVAGEGAFQLLADFFVFVGDDTGEQFDDGNVGAVHAVDVGELDADGAAADDGDGGGGTSSATMLSRLVMMRWPSTGRGGDAARPGRRWR